MSLFPVFDGPYCTFCINNPHLFIETLRHTVHNVKLFNLWSLLQAAYRDLKVEHVYLLVGYPWCLATDFCRRI